eukprot:661789-Pyramimonas_sp.AAC.1
MIQLSATFRRTDDAAEDRALGEGVSPEPIPPVNPARHLARRVEPLDGRLVLTQHPPLRVDG